MYKATQCEQPSALRQEEVLVEKVLESGRKIISLKPITFHDFFQ